MRDVIPDPQSTRAVYDRQAVLYDAKRGRDRFENKWLERFAACLPDNGRVLDLGCGAGDPIASWFKSVGYHVVGVDFSSEMLALARARDPKGDWRLMDMRALDLPEKFDGVIAFNSFFHLTVEDQSRTLLRISRHLKPGGHLLVTIGPEAGEVGGMVGEERVYHASMDPHDYVQRLIECGLHLRAFVAEDPDCRGHTILMAKRKDI